MHKKASRRQREVDERAQQGVFSEEQESLLSLRLEYLGLPMHGAKTWVRS